MARSRVWSASSPPGSRTAHEVDDAIRELRVDVQEIVNQLIGEAVLATAPPDPVVPADRTIAALFAAKVSNATIGLWGIDACATGGTGAARRNADDWTAATLGTGTTRDYWRAPKAGTVVGAALYWDGGAVGGFSLDVRVRNITATTNAAVVFGSQITATGTAYLAYGTPHAFAAGDLIQVDIERTGGTATPNIRVELYVTLDA